MEKPTPAELVRELRGDLSHDKFAALLVTDRGTVTGRGTVIRWEQGGGISQPYRLQLAVLSDGQYRPEDFGDRKDGVPAVLLDAAKAIADTGTELARTLALLQPLLEQQKETVAQLQKLVEELRRLAAAS